MVMLLKINLKLAFPPSVNHYWLHVPKRGVVLSREARAYRLSVQNDVFMQLGFNVQPIVLPVSVALLLYPPDKKRRDIDNYTKGLFDSLTSAGVWLDDSQVKDLRISWKKPEKGGYAFVTIKTIG